MSLLHHHPGRLPFDDPPPETDRVAELLVERRDLCTQLVVARAETDRILAENHRLRAELAHVHRQLQKRWWRR